MQHRPQHNDICILIALLKHYVPNWDTPCLYFDDWITSQKNLIQRIRSSLTREVKPYEVQMFMFVKSCFICHQQDILYTCEICLSISYCADHIDQIYLEPHEAICTQLAISLDIDILFSTPKTSEILNMQFPIFPDKEMVFTDINSFCNQYYHETRMHDYYYLHDYVLADYISGPLTLYNGLQSVKLFRSIKLMDTFVVHIIVADCVDEHNFPGWELFLHFLNEKVKLVLVMIGPELQHKTNEYKVCSHCKTANKRLIIQFIPLLYHNYVHNINYRRPNVIIRFQAELNYDKSSSEFIRAIQTQDCPLFLTAKAAIKAEENTIKIKEVLGTSVTPTILARNNFASYRPYRDLDTGCLSYRNMYLIIYKNLKDSSDSMHSSSSCRV